MDWRIVALYSHWCNADAVRVFIAADVPERHGDPDLPDEILKLAHFSSSASRMIVWYSLLHVVVEGFLELDLSDPEIDALLKSEDYLDSLRLFRNATFHYQKDPISPKAMKFLNASDSEKWINSLNSALEKFFLSKLPIQQHIDELKRGGTKTRS